MINRLNPWEVAIKLGRPSRGFLRGCENFADGWFAALLQTLTQSLLKLAASWDFPTGCCSLSLAGGGARGGLGGGARRAADADPDAAGAHRLRHGALGDHDLALGVRGRPAVPGLLAGAGAGQRVAPGEGEPGLRQPATGAVSSLGSLTPCPRHACGV